MNRADLLFASALEDLKSRMGVALADMTPAEVAALVRACDREANPFRGVNADAAGMPRAVCPGVWFWKLTIGAAIWLEEVVEPLVGTGERYRSALVYALMHAREREAFAGEWTERSLHAACARALKRLTVTTDELEAALGEALGLAGLPPRARTREVAAAAKDWASLLVRLEAQTGIPAQDWMWSKSAAYALKSYADLHNFAAALAHQRTPEDPPQRELDAAVEARQRLKVEIAKAVKARKAAAHG